MEPRSSQPDPRVLRAPGSSNLLAEDGKLLILLNPGRFTRHSLMDMLRAAERLGIAAGSVEMGDIWQIQQSGRVPNAEAFAAELRRLNVRAVLGSGPNGLYEWPVSHAPDGRPVPFFESLGIAHLLWWTDHPQWANERMNLRADLQPLLRSPNNHHFVKSELAADELRDLLRWPNVHGLPVAEDPERLRPAVDVTPDFDVVVVMGSPPLLDPAVAAFLDQEEPDPMAMTRTVAARIAPQLDALWAERAPRELVDTVTAFGRAWLEQRTAESLTGTYRVFLRLESSFADAVRWLRENPSTYFDALELFWQLARWQRTFHVRYLAKYFRIGVFGTDWSSVGVGGDGAWVNHDDQPRIYARGKIALNLSQAGDEEGVSHKPFQIAACGVPLVHIERSGLGSCFAPGEEVETFRTPREARDVIAALLADPGRRRRMADAARQRVCQEHTWEHRLVQMLRLGATTQGPTVTPPIDLTREGAATPAIEKPRAGIGMVDPLAKEESVYSLASRAATSLGMSTLE